MTGSPLVHVAAAVITDARARVLLARRTEGRDLAGLWEFPGGKLEAGESAQAALARELQEELSIDAHIGAPLIAVAQAYPGKRLRLDVRHVARWGGVPRGREGQALVWVPPHKLAAYAMPPADRAVVAALLQPDRYLVTPAPAEGEGDDAWLARLTRALDAGIRRVQIRLPGVDPTRRERLTHAAAALCRSAGAQVLVNGDAALARETGAGLHLHSAQLHASVQGTPADNALAIRERPVPADVPLAASCHDEADLLAARALGCDFVVLGPLAQTPTHPEATGRGWPWFEQLRECVDLPIYAIGGMTPDQIPRARTHGAQGIAAIRSLWPSADAPRGALL